MIEAITAGIWHVNTSVTIMPGVNFPLRMVIVQLKDDGLLLHSPIAIDDALAAELAELGAVRYLIAPNAFHHKYLASAAERFPDATVLAADGVQVKVPRARITASLSEESTAPFASTLSAHAFHGIPKANEWAFCHLASRTLIVTDLVFNIQRPAGLLTSVVLSMSGTHKRFATSKLLRKFVTNKTAAAQSAAELLRLDFDRVVPSHGDFVDTNAKASLRSAFADGFGTHDE